MNQKMDHTKHRACQYHGFGLPAFSTIPGRVALGWWPWKGQEKMTIPRSWQGDQLVTLTVVVISLLFYTVLW